MARLQGVSSDSGTGAMLIEAGSYPIWQDFTLWVEYELEFRQGGFYHLTGQNGSGKSSFISQLLLPRLLALPHRYVLYLEQQMHLQLFTVKAFSAMNKANPILADESMATQFLLKDLKKSFDQVPRDSYLIMDETLYIDSHLAYVRQYLQTCCIIYTSHQSIQPEAESIIFEPVSVELSKVYVRPD